MMVEDFDFRKIITFDDANLNDIKDADVQDEEEDDQ